MDLRLYLFMNNISQKEFAKKLGINRTFFFRARKGICSSELAEKIERLTKGQVTALEVRPPRKDKRTKEMRALRDRTRNKR